MKLTKNLIIAITLGSVITITGCGAQKAEQSAPQSNNQAASSENKSSAFKLDVTSIVSASNDMRNLIKDIKTETANKEAAKVAEGGANLEEAWKQFEAKYEDDLKDRFLDLYVKIEDPLEIIEAAAKVTPLDTKVINTSIDKLDKELVDLQNRNATTAGIDNMRAALKEMNTQLSNKEEDKAVKTSDKLENNWKQFEDGIKASYKDLYEKVEASLGTIQAAVKVTPLDTKVLTTSINELDKTLNQLQKAIAFSTAPQDMKTALKKINKFISPLQEDKVTKYTDRLEKYWSSIEDNVKAKNPALYEKVEAPLGTIEAGVKIKPIDEKTIKAAAESLDKILTDVQNLK